MNPITAILFFICLSFLIVIFGLAALVLLLRNSIKITTHRRRADADVIEAEYTLQAPLDDDGLDEIESYQVIDALPVDIPYDSGAD
ncbi:MAG TPA: hypothetical protein G4N94_00775 [Caldilineae bacterium]|nr:hypothetical protein [Caldilineae bacterium]